MKHCYKYSNCHQEHTLCNRARVECVNAILVNSHEVVLYRLSGPIRLGTLDPLLPSSSHSDGPNCPSIKRHRRRIGFFGAVSTFVDIEGWLNIPYAIVSRRGLRVVGLFSIVLWRHLSRQKVQAVLLLCLFSGSEGYMEWEWMGTLD